MLACDRHKSQSKETTMFVTDDTFKIELFYKTVRNGNLKVTRVLDGMTDDEKAKYKRVTFELRPLNWQKFNALQRAATVNKGPVAGDDIDWYLYKEKKLGAILVGWDVTDEKGVKVPLTQESIYKLHPVIAETVLGEFDRMTLLGEEERKN
jgi:hypothetical protein